MKKSLLPIVIITIMAISCIKDQAFDLCEPPAHENCIKLGQDYCQKAVLDETISIQVFAGNISDNLLSIDETLFSFVPGSFGTNTFVSPNQLVDNTATFLSLGLDNLFTVKNMTAPDRAWAALASTTNTTIDLFTGALIGASPKNAFPSTPADYILLNWVSYNASGGTIPYWLDVVTDGEGGMRFDANDQAIAKPNFLTPGKAYIVSLTVKDYVSGSFAGVDFNDFRINDDGDRVITYSFHCDAPNFSFVAENSPNFILKRVDINEMTKVGVRIKDFEGGTVYQNESAINDGDPNSPIIYIDNNVQLNVNFDDLGLPAGCYTIEAYDVTDSSNVLSTRCINVLESSVACLHKLQWSNPTNYAGFRYTQSTPFIQTVWFTGNYNDAISDIPNDIFRYNDGTRQSLTSERNKLIQVTTEEMPKHVHKGIALGLSHKQLFLNNEAVVNVTETYQPNFRNTSNNGSAVIEVRPVTENSINNLC